MRRLITVSLCVLLSSIVCSAMADDANSVPSIVPAGPLAMYFDFGVAAAKTANPDINGHYWNNVTNYAKDAKLSLIDDANRPTDVNLVFVSASYASNTKCLTNPDPNLLGDLAIGTATGDAFLHIKPNAAPVFQLTGLNSNSRYVLTFFAGRNGDNDTDVRITQFDVVGASAYSGTLQVSGPSIGHTTAFPNGNDSTVLASDPVVPDANGVIQVSWSAVTGTYGHLAAMKVTEVPHQIVYFDFGTAALKTVNPDTNGRYWNNVTNYAKDAKLSLIDDANTPTDVNLVFVSASYASSTKCLTNPDPNLLGDLAIGTATGDAFLHIKSYAAPVFQLTGLDPNSKYILKFFAGRNADTTVPEATTQYDVVGTNSYSGTLQVTGTGLGHTAAFLNGNDSTVLAGDPVIPDANGAIQVTWSIVTGGYGYLSVMKVEVY